MKTEHILMLVIVFLLFRKSTASAPTVLVSGGSLTATDSRDIQEQLTALRTDVNNLKAGAFA